MSCDGCRGPCAIVQVDAMVSGCCDIFLAYDLSMRLHGNLSIAFVEPTGDSGRTGPVVLNCANDRVSLSGALTS